MMIKKRVIAATFHVCIAFSYLILWLAKWGATTEMMSVEFTPKWHSPAAEAINEINLMVHQNQECYISIYDDIFQRTSNDLDTDWRLMAAIGYIESRFKPYVRSHSGAIGLMQIMPRTAKIHGVTLEKVALPEENINVASRHYNLIDYMLDTPNSISEFDRMALNLASYNGGIGRVHDAQRLARQLGENPYSWGVVRKQLLNLRDPEFYESEVVRNGCFRSAGHTVWYVNNVLRRYKHYCEITKKCPHHLYPVTGHGDYLH